MYLMPYFGNNIVIRNLPRPDPKLSWELHAVNFLLGLVIFVWSWERHEIPWGPSSEQEMVREHNRLTQIRLDSAKPWLVEILAYLGRLDLLRSRTTQLDEPCLAKLKEIALRAELSQYNHPVKETRPVATVEEACYVGSPAALFLERCELMLREGKRLTAILEAEEVAADATRKLKELTHK